MSKPRLIAFYLPQFYPTKENNEWWEPGFTEWTNVTRAKPLFKGHDQPRIPRDLGYYDLRVPETRELQAQFAREAGIEGFCYWHYWFSGRRLLDRVFTDVVKCGNPVFPFCLCWANHSWYKKTWDPSKRDELLIEQTYPGEQDYVDHFYALLPAFRDNRYMKVHGKLVFGVFDSIGHPDFKTMKEIWNTLASENGLNGFYFFGFTFQTGKKQEILERGFDSVVYDDILQFRDNGITLFNKFRRKLFHTPKILSYDDYVDYVLSHNEPTDDCHPCINPNFDHSPRSKEYGVVLWNHSPEKWKRLCLGVFSQSCQREREKNLVFIKAWNEWGEGNYMEPDHRYGKGFIEETHCALKSFSNI